MAYYVHLHVCFSCDNNDDVAKLAARHLVDSRLDDWDEDAVAFLTDLSSRSGENPGPKGGLSLWGHVGDYSDGMRFCEDLRPFWQELLSGDMEGGPCSHDNVIVFCERESSMATAFEIGLTESGVNVNRHDCSFRFGQE